MPSSQFAFAKRRCSSCNSATSVFAGTRTGHLYYCYSCNKRSSYLRKRHLLKWIFKLTYSSHLLMRPLLRAQARPSRLIALYALRNIPEARLREHIMRQERFW